jgi:hypothetical protein
MSRKGGRKLLSRVVEADRHRLVDGGQIAAQRRQLQSLKKAAAAGNAWAKLHLMANARLPGRHR